MMKAARLCAEQLSSGRTCRQLALQHEYVCRHHMSPYRHGTYDCAHQEAMERLAATLASMDMPQLLRTLRARLNRIERLVRHNPEASLALSIALKRLREATAKKCQQNQ